jgi:hypothetical protein
LRHAVGRTGQLDQAALDLDRAGWQR